MKRASSTTPKFHDTSPTSGERKELSVVVNPTTAATEKQVQLRVRGDFGPGLAACDGRGEGRDEPPRDQVFMRLGIRLAICAAFCYHRAIRIPGETSPPQTAAAFATTHWSVVLAARDGDSRDSLAALERLCRAYWRPVYAYIRREGHGPADTQDLTQEFLSRLVHKDWLSHLHDQRGRFRSFLLTLLKHFLSDERE